MDNQTDDRPPSGSNVSARQITSIVCAVIAIVCAFAVLIIQIQENKEQKKEQQYEKCLNEERYRISNEGSLLEPEDFCDIYPGR